MSEYTKVVIETDSKGRMDISALDDNGAGHGYRLAGPKFVNDLIPGVVPARPRIRVELDERDVQEIRSYLEICVVLGEFGLSIGNDDDYAMGFNLALYEAEPEVRAAAWAELTEEWRGYIAETRTAVAR